MQRRRPCQATTKAGRACSQLAVEGETTCRTHLPATHELALRSKWPKGTHGSHGPSPSEMAKKVAVELVGPTEGLAPREAHDLTRETARRVQQLASDRVDRVFAVWDELLNDPMESSTVKVTVGSHLLDRAAGKPGQHHDVSIGVADWLASPTDVTDDDDVIDAA